ncbi:DNA repair protein RAD50 [Euphorbia lathyris]|uniref:DNA repair protein RAD50 n=1 Tax=Euphorbia lathyris TaxID=212925 RepID=UPI0033141E81
MSTVDKMLIKGIRSFDPENKNVITFFKPLTLIVGPNGAGKTTIIECLKLSCTGELPPNARSGHSFIHDPKVAGETETKGQIKLRFKTAAGKDVVCIRSFQLTQKASKMEYKAIESVLQTINPHTGEKVCLSYRCADMDREIPALMGVSKAILENVIFVHQDEANWPLQDPSTLKKKFDDIFSATRYTKALEVIKKLHKDQNQEIKTYKLKLENLQTHKNSAYKLRESIVQDEERIESLKVQIQDLENKVQNVDVKIDQADTMLKDLRKLQEKISTKTAERRTLKKEQQRQYEALEEEIEDPDEDLVEWKTKFDKTVAELEFKISKLEREKNDTETDSFTLKENVTKYLQDIGMLRAEAELQNSKKKERDSIIEKLCARHNLQPLPCAPFSDDVALNLTYRFESRLSSLEKDLQEKKTSNDAEVTKAEGHSRDLCYRWKDMDAEKQAKVKSKNDILEDIRRIEQDCALLEEISPVDISRIEEKEGNMETEFKRKKHKLNEQNFESHIRQKQSELRCIDQKIRDLNREKDTLTSNSEARIELHLKETELEKYKRNHKKIIDEYRDRIRGVLKGRLPPDKEWKKEITQALSALGVEFDDLNSKSREAEKEVNVLQMKIQEANNNLPKLRRDLDSRKRFIESKLQSLDQQYSTIDSYLKVLESAKDKRDDQTSKYNIAAGMKQMFDPFERVARAHHICPCCERPFSAEEEDEFVKKQRLKAASSSEHMKVLAMESSNADSYFQKLDKLRLLYEEYLKIGKETVPLTEKNLHELTEELDQKSQALDDLLGVLAQIKADKDMVEKLVQPVETADRFYQEIQALQERVNFLEDQGRLSGQGFKSMEEIQSELSGLQSTREALSNDVEKLRDDQTYMVNDLHNCQLRRQALKEEKLKADNKLSNLKRIEEELERLVEKKNQVELEEKHLAEALGPLAKEREKAETYHSELKDKLEHEYEEQKKQFDNYKQEVDTLRNCNLKIKEYNDLKKGERLQDIQEKLSLSKSKLQSCEDKKQEISVKISDNKEIIQSQAMIKRNIEDNLNYRKTKADVDKLTHEIESLEDQILKIGGISTFEAELARYSQERERLLSELNRCRGTISVYQTSVTKNKTDLKQAQYKDIDKRFFDQLIQLKTTEMANKDLDRYYNALDKALMRFHSMKMEEINKIIRELWQQTYRGQDIDYISIHSDSEGAGTRSYSYRVLMQTGDAELEMRGRCSAGQKVLASLIIRLALAETFCLNCGILALDEPTTNLDGPNAESLAGALHRIMEDRKGQENFQLIVITHDERFAQLIGQRQHAERYYRVAKDDHQHSIIEAQEIFD